MFFGKKFSGYHGGSLSGLDILVLSMIKNKEGISGYELIQKINKQFKDLWKASAGTIYPLLTRLAHKKFVKIKKVIDHNRHKKIYEITQEGNAAIRKVLESNLQPSIDTLGDYIRTVIKDIPIHGKIEEACSCFPFHDFSYEEKVNESDLSLKNIKYIEMQLRRLKDSKQRLMMREEQIEKRINKFESILKDINAQRQRNSKTIPIVENEEFEDF